MAQYSSYITGTQYSPTDMMQRESDWVNEGVLSTLDLNVTAGSGLSVYVKGAIQGTVGGNAWLPKGYRFYNDSQKTVTLSTAHATYSRIDLIVAGIDTTTNPYTPTIKAITGTPSASPVVPTIPATLINIVLAKVLVTANQTTMVSGNITDLREVSSLKTNVIVQDTAPTNNSIGTVWIQTS